MTASTGLPVAATRAGVGRPLGARREGLTLALGLAWLTDAALQYQPYMFSTAFPREVIAPAADGSPGWVAGPVHWSAALLAGHIGPLNALFATVQLAIAVGLFLRPLRRWALAGSIAWSLGVWWLGEGLGGVLAGAAAPVLGFPGAVIVYALVAVLLWPVPDTGGGASVADAGPLRTVGARAVWVALWAAFVYESLLPADRGPRALADMVRGMADGEPGWLAAVDRRAAALLAGHGTAAAVALTVVFGVLAVCGLLPRIPRPVILLGVAVFLLIWFVGQDLGGILTGRATDLNSGLPIAVLLLCYWPTADPADPADPGDPAPPGLTGRR